MWELWGILEQPHPRVTVQSPESISAHPGLLQLLSLLSAVLQPGCHTQPWALPAAHGAQGAWMDEEPSCWCWAGLSVRRQEALQLFL